MPGNNNSKEFTKPPPSFNGLDPNVTGGGSAPCPFSTTIADIYFRRPSKYHSNLGLQ
jgi:hypothetical protein